VATERQRLGEIVGHVADAGNMSNAKLALRHAVLQPISPHVAGFGELGLDGLVDEPDRHLVVAMDDGGGLRVLKVMEDLAFGDSNLGRGERVGVLGILDRGTDDGDAVGVGRDGCIDEGGVRDTTEVVKGAHDTCGVGARQEGGIRENVEDHVGVAENIALIAVSRDISQQTVELGHGVGGGAGLGPGEVAGGGQDPSVDTPAIVQQIAYGYLKFFALGRCSEGRQIGSGTLGRGGAVVRWV
jgi:hypothetical protein